MFKGDLGREEQREGPSTGASSFQRAEAKVAENEIGEEELNSVWDGRTQELGI